MKTIIFSNAYTGPAGLPFIGYLPFLKNHDPKYLFKSLAKMSYIYGPVVGFFVGPQPVVSVCGYDAVNEAFNNPDLDGRMDSEVARSRSFGQRFGLDFSFNLISGSYLYIFIMNVILLFRHYIGYMITDGAFWQEQRRFALRHLRDLGFGRTSSENLIQEEIHDLIQELKIEADSCNGIVGFNARFNIPLLSVLWSLIGGERFHVQDERLKQLVHVMSLHARNASVVNGALPLPLWFLRRIPIFGNYISKTLAAFKPIQDFIRVCCHNASVMHASSNYFSFYNRQASRITRKSCRKILHATLSTFTLPK